MNYQKTKQQIDEINEAVDQYHSWNKREISNSDLFSVMVVSLLLGLLFAMFLSQNGHINALICK